MVSGVQLLWAVGFWCIFPAVFALDSNPCILWGCFVLQVLQGTFVEVTFIFLCLPEDAVGRLDRRFTLTICLLMTRTACLVLRAPFSSELSELWRGELWSIVWDYHIRNAISCKVTLQLSYTCGCFGISEPVNFPEIGQIVHSNETILVVKIADVYCDFFPWPVSGLMGNQCFLGLLSWVLAAYFMLG